jgi:hypothetical protein
MALLPAIKNIEAHPITNENGATDFVLGFTPTAGNILLFGFATRLPWSTATIASTGATWVQIGTEVVNSTSRLVAYHSGVLAANPGSTITVTFPSTQHGAIIFAEIENVEGLDASTPVTGLGGSNPATGGPFTNTSQLGRMMCLLARTDGDITDYFTGITPSGFAVDLQTNGLENPTSTKQTLAVISGFVSEIAAVTVTGQLGGPDLWTSLMFQFVWKQPTFDVETRAEIEARSWTTEERGLITSTLASHVKAGVERLIVQFRKQPKLVAILESWLVSVQDLEGVFWDIHQIRDIDQATGVNLDTLGRIVGQLRGTLTDAQYRTWLKARILANRSRCTVDEILEILIVIEPDAELGVIESYPAAYIVTAYGVTDDDPLGDILRAVKPAGVAAELWSTTLPVAGLFEFADGTIVTDVAKGLADDDVADPGGSMINLEVL